MYSYLSLYALLLKHGLVRVERRGLGERCGGGGGLLLPTTCNIGQYQLNKLTNWPLNLVG